MNPHRYINVSYTTLRLFRFARDNHGTSGVLDLSRDWQISKNTLYAIFYKAEEQGLMLGPAALGLTDTGKRYLELIEEIIQITKLDL